MAPLPPSAHRLAQRFCQQHKDSQKVKQVYLNTLAVSAVEFYLGCMGVETNRSSSQSCDPIVQTALDIADLDLLGRGKVECRPLLPETSVLRIPPEAWSDRIATIAVQLSPSLKAATLLGFAPSGCHEIAIDELRSLDDLTEYLNLTQPPVTARIHLSHWLENQFTAGWQSLTALTGLNQPRLASSFRNSVPSSDLNDLSELETRRAKLIDLGVQLGFESVALLVAITPLRPEVQPETPASEAEPRIEIWVQIHPVGDADYLPPEINLSLLAATGETLQAVQSRHQDNYIQLKRFRGTPGEAFDLKISFGEMDTTESFVI
ncbi:MAG: DUF1822 family protein [Phormidesmis sp. RL_2_1]|nr:DUF1822 family protein [Phormidesmis sp. RL_2_1]